LAQAASHTGCDLAFCPRPPPGITMDAMVGSTQKASLWSSTRYSAKQPLTASDPDDTSDSGGVSPLPLPAGVWEEGAPDAVAPLHHYVSSLGRRSMPAVQDRPGLDFTIGGKGDAPRLPAVPHCFLCPIGQKIMSDPVIAADGVTYERAKIAAMLEAGRRTSPATGRPLPTLDLHPNAGLRDAISGYLDLRRSVERQWGWLEGKMSDYTGQINRKLNQGEARIRELQKDIETLQSGGSNGGSGNGRGPRKVAGGETAVGARFEAVGEAGSAMGAVGVPALALPKHVVEEDSSLAKPSPITFSAGPAPRSARGPGGSSTRGSGNLSARGPGGPGFGSLSTSPSPPAARHNETPSGSKGHYSSALPGFFAALTPRFSQLAKSPRDATRV